MCPHVKKYSDLPVPKQWQNLQRTLSANKNCSKLKETLWQKYVWSYLYLDSLISKFHQKFWNVFNAQHSLRLIRRKMVAALMLLVTQELY